MALSVDGDTLYFEFPEVHGEAELAVSFHRTVRVPDDGKRYPLPPSLGTFPLRVVDEHIVLPVWQSEACWIKFDTRYPFLVKVGTGDVDAVTGGPWTPEPDFDAEDYFEVPEQPWLDGFCVDGGLVRQFVAMPLGAGYTVEEQLGRGPATGGIRIAASPMKADVYERRRARTDDRQHMMTFAPPPPPGMGLGAGGSITQRVATPVEERGVWDTGRRSAAHVALVNSVQWETLTGTAPPTEPITAREYTERGYPWFEVYDESVAREAATALSGVETVSRVLARRGDDPLAGNDTVDVPEPLRIRPRKGRDRG
ncbi:hypothetical protein TVH25_07745 [Rhodococcus sp. 7Tela_A2]|uniref:hypothetical protein n=1 Tax=Rhodococcus sp. 7Tela_A2 TaxID=3093744 RepID=UPI003BB57C5E